MLPILIMPLQVLSGTENLIYEISGVNVKLFARPLVLQLEIASARASCDMISTFITCINDFTAFLADISIVWIKTYELL